MRSTILLQQLKREYSVDVENLIGEVKNYLPDFHEIKLRKAFAFSALAHEGQLRKSGHPYIIHPYETARILSSLHVDEDTLIAALLHDVPEDTEKSIEEIESKFGKKIAFLVEGITKLSKVHYRNEMANRQVESLKKLFIHTAKDPRIILIKLADRLHNMRTLNAINKPEKITRISRETLEIFVPIANLLGIEELKTEMEDLCFKHLYPEDYQILSDRLKAGNRKNEHVMDSTIEMIKKELSAQKISCNVYGRTKNIYHIYKRTAGESGKLNEYDNMIALRIIVDNKEECYHTLGIIHSLFKPKPGTFRDFISLPKKNGYQSLHTTVFGIKGVTTEFQIRSRQMHLEAEYGIAAQYFEKSNKTPHLQEDGRANWACKIMQMQKLEQNSVESDFMEKLKDDILHDRIFVFTPKGKTVDLPKDATCVDFAYEIHTEVGNRAIKAEVNGQIVPVTTKLQNSDTVNIVTSDMPKGPSRSWLAFVKTNTAKGRILEYFRKVSKEEKISTGRRLLQKELDWAGLGMINEIPQKKLKLFCKNKKGCSTIEDVLLKIGEGTLSPLDFVNGLYPHKDVPTNKIMLFLERKFFHTDSEKKYTMVTLKISSRDAIGQMRRILREIAEHNLNIVFAKGHVSFWTGELVIKVTICVENYSQISQVCEAIEHVEGVRNVTRRFFRKKIVFSMAIAFTFALWASHPYFLHYISTHLTNETNPYLSSVLLYAGTFMLFMMVFLLKRLTQRSFPELRETNTFWTITFLLTAFAVITLFAEIYFFELSLNWIILLGLVLLILAYLTAEYVNFRKKF
jgi:GTP pyrophosphokinase